MDYVIAIPSYKRNDVLRKKTLEMLKRYKIPSNKINIFLANKTEYDIYNKELDPKTYNKLVVGKPGIKNIRNFMSQHFNEGQHIVYLDDDIGKIWECNNDGDPNDKTTNKLTEIKSFSSFVKKAFKLSEKTGFRNWSVYPRDNPFFMKSVQHKDHITTDLRFLMGGFHGVINCKKAEVRTIGDKEDYERTIKYYLNDGGVIRFNNISCYTRVYKVQGGLQETQRKLESNKSSNTLIKNYPSLVSINHARNSPFVEIKLRDLNKSKSMNKSGNKSAKKKSGNKTLKKSLNK
jgi:hypothetical protein